MSEKFYPKSANIGCNCSYWGLDGVAHCCFPKHELQGRTTCCGVIDDVCLYVREGREPSDTTKLLLGWPSVGMWLSTQLPPGEIT